MARHRFNGRSTDDEVRAILEIVAKTQYGSLLPYGEIEPIIGHQRGHSRFGTVINRAKKKSRRELHKVLKARPNEGYVVLTPGEQTLHSVTLTRQGVRRIREGEETARTVETKDFNAVERKAHDFILTHIADIAGSVSKAVLTCGKVARTKALPWPTSAESG